MLDASTRRFAAVLSIVLIFAVVSAFAQTNAFTYQGKLSDGANTAPTGTYDLQFTLYDAGGAATGGATLIKEDVQVTSGVFTVSLDFTATPFTGNTARSLEIGVRAGTSTGAFTVLAPRQAITSAPYAIQSANAANSANLGGIAASSYLQTNGSGANLTNLNASNISSGTLDDARLSSNVALRNSANTFTGNQTINGDLTQTGTTTDLNLTNGFVARGAFGTGAIPATGAGSRLMFYPGKAAFRAGRVFNNSAFSGVDGTTFWDEANVGAGSAAFGSNNRASGANSFAGGTNSTASGANSFAFSSSAQANGDDSVALGGSSIAGSISSIAIGPSRANGAFAVAIGVQNSASGNFSIAIGKNADTSNKPGSIVISDGCAAVSTDVVNATANNQVNIRGCGGFRFFTSQNTGNGSSDGSGVSGVSLASGGNQWQSLSDRNSKENFAPVNSRDVLRKVLNLPITTWNYKSQDASIRHIGAMAQDFKAAFAVGEDDKHISALDPDGVALAAIQGLNEELNEQTKRLKAENAALNRRVAAQAAQLDELEARLKRLEQRSAKSRRANKRRK